MKGPMKTMKKNILLLVASAAMLASCGAGSPVATAPTDKGVATPEQTEAVLKKATESLANVDGAAIELGVDASVKASVPGALLGLEKDLTESLSLNGISLKAAAGVKDGKLVEAASLSGGFSAGLDLPKAGEEAISIEHKDISANLSAKEYIADDKVYLDGTGLFDAVQKVAEIASIFGADTRGLPEKAEDMKGYITLENGICAQAATLFTQYVPMLPTLITSIIPEGVELHSFSDGSIGVSFNIEEVLELVGAYTEQIPAAVIEVLNELDGKFVVTIAESGALAAYAEVKGTAELPIMQGVNVSIEVNAKASASIKFGKVNVETVSDPDSYTPLILK